ncbi:MAG TPA: type II toxin-antitoxin system VapC family toxin [Burkholderiaceae bacterium]
MVYLDTSVVVALLIAEPRSDEVASWFARSAAPLAASDWLVTEFASALAIKRSGGQIASALLRAARREFDALYTRGLQVIPIDRDTFAAAAELIHAVGRGLRAGDALHLAAARRAGAGAVATIDPRMAEAASRIGLAVELGGRG